MIKKQTIFFCIFLSCSFAYSDEWVVPGPQEFYSQNGLYCLVIKPSIIPDTDHRKVGKRSAKSEKYNSKKKQDSIVPCHAILYKTGENYPDWTVLWERDLENPVSPYKAFVTNDGKYVVSFDDWYHLGKGENVMVVYGNNGELLRKFELNEITSLSDDQLKVSVTSIWWYQGVESYSEDPARIVILVKDKNFNIEKRIFNLDELKFE